MAFLSQISDFDPTSLRLLQRLFLISDGTLTDLVEAAFLEPIAVRKVSIATSPAVVEMPSLELEAGQLAMSRKILLYGETTLRNFVYAESVLAVDRLPAAFRSDLVESDKPLGRLWSEHKVETWKELLVMHRRPPGSLGRYFNEGVGGDLITRTYRLISGGRPLMLISEYFPAEYAGQPQ